MGGLLVLIVLVAVASDVLDVSQVSELPLQDDGAGATHAAIVGVSLAVL